MPRQSRGRMPICPQGSVEAAPRAISATTESLPKGALSQLFEQYLFSVLYRAFYLSFLAENRERLRHMDGALRTS